MRSKDVRFKASVGVVIRKREGEWSRSSNEGQKGHSVRQEKGQGQHPRSSHLWVVCRRSRCICRLRDWWERGGLGQCEEAAEDRDFSTGGHDNEWHTKRLGGYLCLTSHDKLRPRTSQKRPVRIKTTTCVPKAPLASIRLWSCTWMPSCQRQAVGVGVETSHSSSSEEFLEAEKCSRAVLVLHLPSPGAGPYFLASFGGKMIKRIISLKVVLICTYPLPPILPPPPQRIGQWATKFSGIDDFNIIKIVMFIAENSGIKNKYKEDNESHTLSLHLEITTLSV